MPKYEYVKRKEYQPVREELEEIIKRAQKILKKNAGITFQFELIGSGSRHLITREIDGNKGFDFDYNLILNCEEGHYWKPDYARKEVYKAINEAISGTGYDHPENHTVAIRIKYKDRKNSRIIHSCDFAVIYYPDDNEDQHKYARLNSDGFCTWEFRGGSKDYHIKLDWLKENVDNYWNVIRDEYLELKNNNNDINKHSFQLFFESINNVYNYFVNY